MPAQQQQQQHNNSYRLIVVRRSACVCVYVSVSECVRVPGPFGLSRRWLVVRLTGQVRLVELVIRLLLDVVWKKVFFFTKRSHFLASSRRWLVDQSGRFDWPSSAFRLALFCLIIKTRITISTTRSKSTKNRVTLLFFLIFHSDSVENRSPFPIGSIDSRRLAFSACLLGFTEFFFPWKPDFYYCDMCRRVQMVSFFFSIQEFNRKKNYRPKWAGTTANDKIQKLVVSTSLRLQFSFFLFFCR